MKIGARTRFELGVVLKTVVHSGAGARGASWLTGLTWPLVLLMLFVSWLVLFWPWLSGTVTIPYDAKAHFHAQFAFLARALATGQSPFWTPNVFAGSPQIADPQSLIFSPALLIALVDGTPSFWVVDLYVLLSLLAGGAAIVGFGREQRWHPAAALLAGIAFAFAGSAYWRIQHIGQIESYAFLGVAMWLLARALRVGSAVSGALAGAAAGLMIVQPDQIAYLGLFVLVGVVVDRVTHFGWNRATVRHLWRPLTAGAVACTIIAAFPLLLTVLFAAASNRPEIGITEANAGSLHPASLLTFVLGDIYGAADPKVDYWGPSSAAWSVDNLFLSQNMTQVYVGSAVVVALFVLGFFRGYAFARPVRVYTALLTVFVLYALGRYTPAFAWMFEHVPGVSAFRRPADATFLIGALAAIVAGAVIDRHLRAPDRSWVTVIVALTTTVLTALVAVTVAQGVGRLAEATPALVRGTALVALAATVLIASARLGRRSPLIAAVVIGAFATFDLFVSQQPNESTGLPPARYEALEPNTRNETVAFLRTRLDGAASSGDRQRVELLGVGFEWPNLGMIHGFDHTLGYNPLRLAEFAEATGARDTIAGPDQRRFTPLFPSYRCRLANLLGMRYVVSPVPLETVDRRLRGGELPLVARTKDTYIYENPDALPRVLVATNAIEADFEAIISTGVWPTFEPRRTVLLDSVPDDALAPAMPQSPGNRPRARIVSYENTRVEVEVTSDTPGYLVLHDVWHPWWTASVNGETTPILKANVLFRAVRIEAGRSTVVFTFEPVVGAMAELQARLFPGQETD